MFAACLVFCSVLIVKGVSGCYGDWIFFIIGRRSIGSLKRALSGERRCDEASTVDINSVNNTNLHIFTH